MYRSRCEAECRKYPWCRGILVLNSGGTTCRLLTKEQPSPIDGWEAKNFGNWAEPDQWKNGLEAVYKCYEKVLTGTFQIMRGLRRLIISELCFELLQ